MILLKYYMSYVFILMVSTGAIANASTFGSGDDNVIGEGPVLYEHLDQNAINEGDISIEELFIHGERIFGTRFNKLDGQGRPYSKGFFLPRAISGPDFSRISGPDASSCFGCHHTPIFGGTAGFAAQVFQGASATGDPIITELNPDFFSERGSMSILGLGPIEMLAREMTEQLHQIKDNAILDAEQSGIDQTVDLNVKGVSFGSLTVNADTGLIDPSNIEGVDWDLIVKPFLRSGVFASIRDLNVEAYNIHSGIQAVEAVGLNSDPDGDGIVNELTVGDITAAEVWMAATRVPTKKIGETRRQRYAIRQGGTLFNDVGCNDCHKKSFIINTRHFSSPNPYGNAPLSVENVQYDMTKSKFNDLQKIALNKAKVNLYSDLKRYNLCDDELTYFCSNDFNLGQQRIGTADPSLFSIESTPLPSNERLTVKLWDIGSTDPYGKRGDLTLLSEVILSHGGDAKEVRNNYVSLSNQEKSFIIEYLQSLTIEHIEQKSLF